MITRSQRTERYSRSSRVARTLHPHAATIALMAAPPSPSPSRPPGPPLRILVYSDNPRTREQVRLALGKRVHPELPELSYVEVATGPMVIRQMDAGGFDLAILDGEATPVGGMGIAKQLKDEIDRVHRCWC